MNERANIIGAGPNGLAAAIVLAKAGLDVTVFESAAQAGGGARTEEVTLPGFKHDLGSSIHPMAAASPLFRKLQLEQHGLRWLTSPAALAHPLDDGTAVVLYRDIARTCENLGEDGKAYEALSGHLSSHWNELQSTLLGPLSFPPSHPFLLARFGAMAALPASLLARTLFRGTRARALFAGLAAHSILPLNQPFTSAIGIVLGAVAHVFDWPFPEGGASAITQSLIKLLHEHDGKVICNHTVRSLSEDDLQDLWLADVTPRQLLGIAGGRLDTSYMGSLQKFRYGPGVFKIDWALSEPIPWTAKECKSAATVHVGGTLEEVEASEAALCGKAPATQPFVLLSQTSLFDRTRAPLGKHTAWAYCHVPQGWRGSMLDAIESQIERFAPGFRDCILERRVWDTLEMEAYNSNLVGGDIGAGALTWNQLFARPSLKMYKTSHPKLFLCSASTPPGPGVHGMCGYHGASAALRSLGRQPLPLE